MKKILLMLILISATIQACSSESSIAASDTPPNPPTEIAPTSYPAVDDNASTTGQHPYSFLTSSGEEVRYLLFLPENLDSQEEWPAIVYFHGAGSVGTGDNIEKLLKEGGLPEILETDSDFPFIVISPQSPSAFWSPYIDPVDELLTHLSETLPLDTHRLYLTGVSRGAHGVWQYALDHPDRFAAIAPISGGASLTSNPVPADICTLNTLPIWVFHGEDDVVVSPELDKAVVAALESCGSDIKFTLYPEAGHKDAWVLAYGDRTIFDWFLEHAK